MGTERKQRPAGAQSWGYSYGPAHSCNPGAVLTRSVNCSQRVAAALDGVTLSPQARPAPSLNLQAPGEAPTAVAEELEREESFGHKLS